MTDAVIAPVTDTLRRAAIEDGWFLDEGTNRARGYGGGPEGVLAATEAFGELLSRSKEGDPNTSLLGVYDGSVPIGFFATFYLGEQRRAVQIDLMMDRLEERENIARSALEDLLKILYEQTDRAVYRVQAEALCIRKDLIRLLQGSGFTKEGIHRRSFWVNEEGYDTTMLRLLRCDYEHPVARLSKDRIRIREEKKEISHGSQPS